MEHPAVPRSKCPWVRGRDLWYGDAVPAQQSTCQVRLYLHCAPPLRLAKNSALHIRVIRGRGHVTCPSSWPSPDGTSHKIVAGAHIFVCQVVEKGWQLSEQAVWLLLGCIRDLMDFQKAWGG